MRAPRSDKGKAGPMLLAEVAFVSREIRQPATVTILATRLREEGGSLAKAHQFLNVSWTASLPPSSSGNKTRRLISHPPCRGRQLLHRLRAPPDCGGFSPLIGHPFGIIHRRVCRVVTRRISNELVSVSR
jgi:hypothetical protein